MFILVLKGPLHVRTELVPGILYILPVHIYISGRIESGRVHLACYIFLYDLNDRIESLRTCCRVLCLDDAVVSAGRVHAQKKKSFFLVIASCCFPSEIVACFICVLSSVVLPILLKKIRRCFSSEIPKG